MLTAADLKVDLCYSTAIRRHPIIEDLATGGVFRGKYNTGSDLKVHSAYKMSNCFWEKEQTSKENVFLSQKMRPLEVGEKNRWRRREAGVELE